MKLYGYIPGDNKDAIDEGKMWTATGEQFAVPYVFKTLFSKEEITFDDLCEVKSVAVGALYLKDANSEQFIGRVGQFCPMKEGYGKELLVLRDEKFAAPPGTKGYLWLESEYVRDHHLEDDIDISYYESLAIEAVHTIAAYDLENGFEGFVGGKRKTEYSGEAVPFA